MTITVHENIIEGSEFGYSSTGPFATRVFKVKTDASETMAQILLHDDIPQYAEIYPGTGDTGGFQAIYAFDFRCTPLENDNSVYQVFVNYSAPDFQQREPSEDAADAIITVGTSVTAGKTQVDRDGNQLVITLNGQTQNGELDVQIPQNVLGFQRRESSNPAVKSRTYSGKVNSVALGSGAYAIGTLLCIGIEGESDDGGETYVVRYSFQYEPATWEAVAVFRDPETDLPAEGVNTTTDAGVLRAYTQEEADFSALNLPFPT